MGQKRGLGLVPEQGPNGGSRLEEGDTAVSVLCVMDVHTPNCSHEPAVNPNRVSTETRQKPSTVLKGKYLQRGPLRTSPVSFTHTQTSGGRDSPHLKPPESEGCLTGIHLLRDHPRSGTPAPALPQLCKAKHKERRCSSQEKCRFEDAFSLGEAESSLLLPGSWV